LNEQNKTRRDFTYPAGLGFRVPAIPFFSGYHRTKHQNTAIIVMETFLFSGKTNHMHDLTLDIATPPKSIVLTSC